MEIRHGQNEPGLLFHRKRHPLDMGAPEITRFLSALAVDGNVAASTQNQALSALLFLYREVLDLDVPWLDDLVRAKRPIRLPIVLTRDEVGAVLQPLEGVPRLMGTRVPGTWRSGATRYGRRDTLQPLAAQRPEPESPVRDRSTRKVKLSP